MPRTRTARCAECSAPATLARSATRRNRLGFDETTVCWRCERGHETYEYEVDPRQRGTMLTYDRTRLRPAPHGSRTLARVDHLLIPLVVDPETEYNPN